MHDPTEQDLELADRVNEIAPNAFPISTDGPQPEHVRREMAAASARAQRLAFDQARICVAAIPPAVHQSPFYQPFDGAVIFRDGQPWWGMFYAAGVYVADAETARRAQRHLIEIDHRQALRENDYRDRCALRFAVTEQGRSALAETSQNMQDVRRAS
ncbi:MAG TPA: hypothetical protein VGH98_16635 [Gemmatimonadaceae bacterium]|jgi:hypothetical protein